MIIRIGNLLFKISHTVHSLNFFHKYDTAAGENLFMTFIYLLKFGEIHVASSTSVYVIEQTESILLIWEPIG